MAEIQTTLPEVKQEVIVPCPKHKYSTLFFEVSITETQLDKVLSECDRKTKQGMAIYTAEEKLKIKMVFVQKKMRCVSVWPLFSREWGESALALYKEVFNEVYA